MAQEDDMLLISEVALRTGIPVNTLRHWARTGQLSKAKQIPILGGYAWQTTIEAAMKRRDETKMGRPPKKRG